MHKHLSNTNNIKIRIAQWKFGVGIRQLLTLDQFNHDESWPSRRNVEWGSYFPSFIWQGKITDSKGVSRTLFFFLRLDFIFICFMCVCARAWANMSTCVCRHVCAHSGQLMKDYSLLPSRQCQGLNLRRQALPAKPSSKFSTVVMDTERQANCSPASDIHFRKCQHLVFSKYNYIKYLSWKMAYNNWPVILPLVLYFLY